MTGSFAGITFDTVVLLLFPNKILTIKVEEGVKTVLLDILM